MIITLSIIVFLVSWKYFGSRDYIYYRGRKRTGTKAGWKFIVEVFFGLFFCSVKSKGTVMYNVMHIGSSYRNVAGITSCYNLQRRQSFSFSWIPQFPNSFLPTPSSQFPQSSSFTSPSQAFPHISPPYAFPAANWPEIWLELYIIALPPLQHQSGVPMALEYCAS